MGSPAVPTLTPAKVLSATGLCSSRRPRSEAAVSASLRAAVERGAEQGRQMLRTAGREGEGRSSDAAPIEGGEVADPTPGFEPTLGTLLMRPDGRVVPPTPVAGAGDQQTADASTSRQRKALEGLNDWSPGLDQRGVPDQVVWRAEAEKALWLEYEQIGASLQNTLQSALTLHAVKALGIHRVSVFYVSQLAQRETTLAEAQAQLQQERAARAEAQTSLQQKRTALEGLRSALQ